MTTTRTPTADRHPADALLAAFVDGRLGGDEHRRLVEHLATCESCREVVAETAKTLRDPELAGFLDGDGDDAEEDGEPSGGSGKVLRPAKSRFRRALPLIAALGAAAAVTALLVWTPVGRGFLGSGERDEASLQAFYEEHGYEDKSQGWNVFLGGSEPALNEQTSFQLGVQLAYLDGALQVEKMTAASVLVARLNLKLDADMIQSSIYCTELETQIRKTTDSESLSTLQARCEESIRQEGDRLHPRWYELGLWAGEAKLASVGRDASWFEDRRHRRDLRHLVEQSWPPAVESPLASISALVDGGIEATEWPRLEIAILEVIGAGGNHETWR